MTARRANRIERKLNKPRRRASRGQLCDRDRAHVSAPSTMDPADLVAQVEATGLHRDTARAPQAHDHGFRRRLPSSADAELTALRHRLIGAVAFGPGDHPRDGPRGSSPIGSGPVSDPGRPGRHLAAGCSTVRGINPATARPPWTRLSLWARSPLSPGRCTRCSSAPLANPACATRSHSSIVRGDATSHIYPEAAANTCSSLAGRYFEKRAKRDAGVSCAPC